VKRTATELKRPDVARRTRFVTNRLKFRRSRGVSDASEPARLVLESTSMSIDRWIRLVAGTFVLVSLALAHYVSPWFLLFTTFVGANLLQSSLTSWCPLTYILRGLGVRG
jgi:hypothetical protein